ncbi:PREDICTED: venom protease-like [Ceratosolen solmsi marchali]|uniref:CLIP domain-containing serine protease n=1 Tax=Ceratosolen solmsi marchali TaxID=326594 RepID=A0AAJ6YMY9_9HYME|nr:PREDICTED: venom protease-like [Ceratosolen solmsi marchali]
MEFYKSYILIILLLGLHIFSQRVLSLEETCDKAANHSLGVCINIKLCDPYLAILRKYGTTAGNFLRSTLCYYENSQPIVCCPRPRTELQQPMITSKPIEPSPNSTYGPLYGPQCGSSNAQHNRVVGGVPADLGAWPWMAALGYKNKKSHQPQWLCGGSLISSRHILTAGHCVYNRYDLYLARLGEHDLKSETDGANPIDVPIERGTIHPQYNSKTVANDIAVLRLKYEVSFTDAIHPICLPLIPEIKNRDYIRHYPFVAGWGAVIFRGPSSSVLLETQLPVVSQENCRNAYANLDHGIDDKVLCAGEPAGGRDACQGDSGGPLMFPKATTYYIIGIVSVGYRCAERGIPGVYTKVSYYIDFILTHLY